MFIALLLASLFPAHAAPDTLGYDGRLLDANGEPIEGAHIVRLSLHTAASQGSEVWSEEHGVTAQGGYFHAELGHTQALGTVLDANASLWVQVAVDGEALEGRTPLNAAPYALSDTLSRLDCAEGDTLIRTGGAWACHTPAAVETFRCEPASWDIDGNVEGCAVTLTLTEPRLVTTMVDGHWSNDVNGGWCIVELLYPGEASYYANSASTPSPYVEQKGSSHGYPYPNWQAFTSVRSEVLPAGEHRLSYYVSESTSSNCNVNGSALRGWSLPLTP